MKKLLLIVISMLLLTSCGESVYVNTEAFEKNINKQFNAEIMNSSNTFTIEDNNENIIYWVPDGYNLCCSMHSDVKTGIIKKYTVTTQKNNQKYDIFCNSFKNAICQNNQNINISTFKTDEHIITVYEDTRYTIDEEIPTLKSEIIEENLKQPVAEKNIKDEN